MEGVTLRLRLWAAPSLEEEADPRRDRSGLDLREELRSRAMKGDWPFSG